MWTPSQQRPALVAFSGKKRSKSGWTPSIVPLCCIVIPCQGQRLSSKRHQVSTVSRELFRKARSCRALPHHRRDHHVAAGLAAGGFAEIPCEPDPTRGEPLQRFGVDQVL